MSGLYYTFKYLNNCVVHSDIQFLPTINNNFFRYIFHKLITNFGIF